MYYETKEGDEELRVLFLSSQTEEEDDEEREDAQLASPRKKRRSEVAMLKEENPAERTSPNRPKRAAGSFFR